MNPDPANLSGRYILDDSGEPVPEPDLMKWCKWVEKKPPHVADEMIGGVRISTIFLALDHNYSDGPPILWETMTFALGKDDPRDQQQDRCSGSREQAEAMHAKMVEWVKGHNGRPS